VRMISLVFTKSRGQSMFLFQFLYCLLLWLEMVKLTNETVFAEPNQKYSMDIVNTRRKGVSFNVKEINRVSFRYKFIA
jgi:hypothetical protein